MSRCLFRLSAGAALLTLAQTLMPGVSLAADVSKTPYSQRKDVQTFINDLVRTDGLKKEEVTRLLAGAERKQSIIDAISKPAEHTLTWGEYRKIFITEDRVTRGVKFYNTHAEVLKRANKQYGVAPEIIVAIIGVETRYGQHRGNYRVVDSLSTLAFDYPPRAKFFQQQLREFLLLGREAGINLSTATGSYAGAIGYPQFIPSSYRSFAVDFDADNKTDLIDNPVDAIGSVANYFKAHKWQTQQPVVKRARYVGAPEKLAALNKVFNQSLKPAVKAGDLAAMGLQTKTPLAPETLVSPMKLEGSKGLQYWIGLENFYVITRYNHSSLYAMAVYQLSEKIKEKL